MSYRVFLTESAEHDLEDLYDYISRHDLPEKAEQILTRFQELFDSLNETPNRGAIPDELRALGIREFREIFFKPYRIVYRVEGDAVYIVLIADGRRDMRSLLERRLLGA